MKTPAHDSQTRVSHHQLMHQPYRNTCTWIGHLELDPNQREAGQVFSCPEEGDIDGIEVYTEFVQQPGYLSIKLHRFNEEDQSWGPVIATADQQIGKKEGETWFRFSLSPVHLERHRQYGFILSSDDAFVAIGEAAWPRDTDHQSGKEWTALKGGKDGRFYDHFSLAYKVDFK